MNRFIQILLLSGLVLAVFSGCSSNSPAPSAPVVQQTSEEKERPQIQAMPMVHPTPREPGSLWSDGSQWNGIYSGPRGRAVGDVVLLKPTDGFKLAVATKSGKGSGAELSTKENAHVVATIMEALPRDVYRIEAKQRLTVGTKEHELKLAGKLRERDIASDDTVSTDVVFDLNLQVEGDKVADATPAKDEKKTSEKESAKSASAKKSEDPAANEPIEAMR